MAAREIYLGNLPEYVCPGRIRELCISFGAVPQNVSQPVNRVAIVRFSTEAEAEAAIIHFHRSILDGVYMLSANRYYNRRMLYISNFSEELNQAALTVLVRGVLPRIIVYLVEDYARLLFESETGVRLFVERVYNTPLVISAFPPPSRGMINWLRDHYQAIPRSCLFFDRRIYFINLPLQGFEEMGLMTLIIPYGPIGSVMQMFVNVAGMHVALVSYLELRVASQVIYLLDGIRVQGRVLSLMWA